MTHYRIGELSQRLGLSIDTLRYYEKIGLLNQVNRTASGIRLYNDHDLSRLRFIQRAQKMNFSLNEIKALLSMREDPQHARDDVRRLTATKLAEVQSHLQELDTLRRERELQLLLNLCRSSEDGCPIIEEIDRPK
jgi:DNA-binding transcriptional MerR regulator